MLDKFLFFSNMNSLYRVVQVKLKFSSNGICFISCSFCLLLYKVVPVYTSRNLIYIYIYIMLVRKVLCSIYFLIFLSVCTNLVHLTGLGHFFLIHKLDAQLHQLESFKFTLLYKSTVVTILLVSAFMFYISHSFFFFFLLLLFWTYARGSLQNM